MRSTTLVPLLALCASCAPASHDLQRDRHRPPPLPPPAVPAGIDDVRADAGPLTLERAKDLVLARSPALAAARAALMEAEGRTLQAGLLPNPELEVEVENFAGSGEFKGFGASESTFLVTQPIPLGGKLGLRAEAARRAEDAVAWRVRADLRRLRAETAAAFVEVLAAQEGARLAAEGEALAQELGRVVAARVEAGKVSPVERTRAAAVVGDARVASIEAIRALDLARRRLARLWGEIRPHFSEAAGDLAVVDEPPDPETLAAAASQDPEVRASEAETVARMADLRAEERAWWPDLTVGAGTRYFADADDYALVGVLSVPLPLFDRGQGSRRAAEAARFAAAAGVRSAWVRVRAAALEALEGLRAARERVRALEDEVLPAAEASLAASREGYRAGKFGYLDVLDAQQRLLDARARRLEALRDYHIHRAALSRWTDPGDAGVH